MCVLADNGDYFDATVDSIEGEVVALSYAASRMDMPELAPPVNLSSRRNDWRSTSQCAVNYNNPSVAVPSIGVLLNELAGPLGIGDVAYDDQSEF